MGSAHQGQPPIARWQTKTAITLHASLKDSVSARALNQGRHDGFCHIVDRTKRHVVKLRKGRPLSRAASVTARLQPGR